VVVARPSIGAGLRPGLTALRERDVPALRGDVLAGLTVAAYLVPQVLAYAAVAGLAPITGLWAATGALAVYAVLGSSRQLSVGPESTTALMTAIAVAPLAAGDPHGTRRSRQCSPSWSVASVSSAGSRGWASWPICSPDPCWSATSPGSP
jgi:MFS superfamily sulfate permease-like transporter